MNIDQLKFNIAETDTAERVSIARTLVSMCSTYSGNLQEELEPKDIYLLMARSNHEDQNAHYYLIFYDDEGQEIIIDPTVSQFIRGPQKIFVGTREELKEICEDPETEIINTTSKDDPALAFQRIWGETSYISELHCDSSLVNSAVIQRVATGGHVPEY